MKNNIDILVIDDEQVILDAIKKITSFEGYSSHLSLSANEALENIKNNEYSLILCDIMMPDVDGFELLSVLRQKRITTPIVITTGFSTLDNAVKALYEGAIGFIPKPFSIEELISIIKRGVEYGKIFNKKRKTPSIKNRVSVDFVPCPPKYFRLGYDSWLSKAEEGLVKIGITDLFLKSIGLVKEIEFFNTEDNIYQGGTCLKILDNKDSLHQVLSPVSGKIIDINEKIVINKTLLEKDPYFSGWIYKVIPENLEHELENITPCSSDF
jgi:CheY-like chemotaxis protein